MKYTVKPEFIDMWTNHGENANTEITVTENDIHRLSIEWDVDMFDLLAQVDIDDAYMSAAVALMDDEIREDIHRRAICDTEAQFLHEYKKRHFVKFGEHFTI